jgi:hypothetical protein
MYVLCLNKVLGGTVQQETVQFTIVGRPVKGLKVLKKTYKGALGPFKVHLCNDTTRSSCSALLVQAYTIVSLV